MNVYSDSDIIAGGYISTDIDCAVVWKNIDGNCVVCILTFSTNCGGDAGGAYIV